MPKVIKFRHDEEADRAIVNVLVNDEDKEYVGGGVLSGDKKGSLTTTKEVTKPFGLNKFTTKGVTRRAWRNEQGAVDNWDVREHLFDGPDRLDDNGNPRTQTSFIEEIEERELPGTPVRATPADLTQPVTNIKSMK